MKSLVEFIKESLDEYYHFTSMDNVVKILEENRFKCSTREDEFLIAQNDKENENDRKYDLYVREYESKFPYFLCTTRQKSGSNGFALQSRKLENRCRIVLDGNKLNSKYKIIPYNFFGSEEGKLSAHREYNKDYQKYVGKNRGDESEDRVLSKKKFIDNASNYIIRIDFCPSDSEYLDEETFKQFKKLSKERNIDIYIYPDKKSFDLGKNDKSYKLDNSSNFFKRLFSFKKN
ncbi:MAG: hypothetical protein J1F35_08195 [Erysipelotrichales bacterium]|nr:hypothetical protein [Erysipelotrichales bacterium]